MTAQPHSNQRQTTGHWPLHICTKCLAQNSCNSDSKLQHVMRARQSSGVQSTCSVQLVNGWSGPPFCPTPEKNYGVPPCARNGQVWTRHLAPAAPAPRPSSPLQFQCICRGAAMFAPLYWSLASLVRVSGGLLVAGSGLYRLLPGLGATLWGGPLCSLPARHKSHWALSNGRSKQPIDAPVCKYAGGTRKEGAKERIMSHVPLSLQLLTSCQNQCTFREPPHGPTDCFVSTPCLACTALLHSQTILRTALYCSPCGQPCTAHHATTRQLNAPTLGLRIDTGPTYLGGWVD